MTASVAPAADKAETKLQLTKFRLDGGTQPREALSEETIREYAETMQRTTLPPVVAFYDGKDYWLADGFHRVMAATELGWPKIAAEVHQGTRRDAVLYSCGVNAGHGLRRTNADKRRAVMKLLTDAEWGKWSDREIARRCSVDNSFVSRVRQEVKPSVDEQQMESPAHRAVKVRRGESEYEQTVREPRSVAVSRPAPPEIEQGVVAREHEVEREAPPRREPRRWLFDEAADRLRAAVDREFSAHGAADEHRQHVAYLLRELAKGVLIP